jgi:hypothetical protein
VSSNSENIESEDGPVFRATISQLEKKTIALRTNVKKMLKLLDSLMAAERALEQATVATTDFLKTLPSYEPATAYMSEAFGRVGKLREDYLNQLQTLVIDPLVSVYELDVKTAENRKKAFDHDSEEFYNFLNRYLSIKDVESSKKKGDMDHKHHAKRRSFDLKRFDYLSYMQDLHGRREREILYYLTSMAEKHALFHQRTSLALADLKPGLDQLGNLVRDATKNMSYQLKEREEKRRIIENRSTSVDLGRGLPPAPAPPPAANVAAGSSQGAPAPETGPGLPSSSSSSAFLGASLSSKPSMDVSGAAASLVAAARESMYGGGAPGSGSLAVAASSVSQNQQLASMHATQSSGSMLTGVAVNTQGGSASSQPPAPTSPSVSIPSSPVPGHHHVPGNALHVLTSAVGSSLGSLTSMAQSPYPSVGGEGVAPSSNKFRYIRDLDSSGGDPTLANLGKKREGFLYAARLPSNIVGAHVGESVSIASGTGTGGGSLAASSGTPGSGSGMSSSGLGASSGQGGGGAGANANSGPVTVTDNTGRRKKFWCVVSNGVFYEYYKWKQGAPKLHLSIDLRLCAVRMVRPTDTIPGAGAGRRFCFEILSSSLRRIYQAVSEDDLQAWIRVLNNAIESLINGLISDNAPSAGPSRDSGSDQSPYPGGVAEAVQKAIRAEYGDEVDRASAEARKDPSNEFCVDCGAPKPEWCSINLGICMCIGKFFFAENQLASESFLVVIQ